MEKNITRIEKGAEFTHKTPKEGVVGTSSVRATVAVISTAVRREGSVFVLSCVLESTFILTETASLSALVGGEGLIVKREEQTLYTVEVATGDGEVEDEFDCESISDVLLHGENVGNLRVRIQDGGALVEGEVGVNICCMRGDMPGNLERLLPFKAELPFSSAVTADCPCEAQASVSFAEVFLRSDEETGKSTLSLSVRLSLTVTAYIPQTVEVATDAFSGEAEVLLETERRAFTLPMPDFSATERITGKAALGEKIDFSTVFEALVCHRAEGAVVLTSDGKAELQGSVSAVLLVRSAGGSHRGIEVELPFCLPYPSATEGERRVEILVLGMSLRQKNEGEADGEATLRINVLRREERGFCALSSVKEGESISPCNSAFSVFLPREGDGAWEIAKALHRPVEDVVSGNPTLTFPVKKGERIIIYRRK